VETLTMSNVALSLVGTCCPSIKRGVNGGIIQVVNPMFVWRADTINP
jgi:hypothetical protein